MNYKNFSYKIYQLKQEENFQAILELLDRYQTEFYQEIQNDKFTIFHILSALRKTGNSNLADKFIEQFQIKFDEEIVLNSYAWNIYENIKNNFINLKQIQSILKLLFQQNSHYSYTIISNILRVGLQKIKNPIFLDFFDKDKLSTTPHKYQNKLFASDKEKWYLAKTKQLFNEKKFQECYNLSKEALEKIVKFSSFNNIWIARRIALSLAHLGDIETAISQLEEIYSKKREWFILGEIAELYYKKGDKEKSFKLAIEAINSNTKLEFKLAIVKLLSQLTDEKISKKHLLLIKKIKEKNGWRISEECQNLEDNVEFSILKKELFQFWKNSLPKDRFQKGVVIKILHDNERGIDGFIKGDKKDYYFKTKKRVQKGDKVEFEIIEEKKAKILKTL